MGTELITKFANIFANAASKSIEVDLESAMRRHTFNLHNDFDRTFKRLKYDKTVIGNVSAMFAGKEGVLPISLYTKDQKVDGPTLLIVAGFHGDEPAGPLSVLSFLEQYHQYTKTSNLSFLPIANPLGCMKLRRWGMFDQDPNRGFIRDKDKISEEGIALKHRKKTFSSLGKDGIMDLHEDPDGKETFVYTWNKGPINELAKDMSKKAEEFFDLAPKSVLRKKQDWESVQKGIIHNIQNGGFEDWMFTSCNIPQIITTETPGLKKLGERVLAGAELIKFFIDHHKQESK